VPSGPKEVVQVGNTVNQLADRIGDLLISEREALADMSHRLRTPLTALQLEVDSLSSVSDRQRLTGAVQRLADAVTELIKEARSPTPADGSSADVAAVARQRVAFWAPLAEDQQREWTSDIPDVALPVVATEDELAAAIDALVTNVFNHTPEGAPYAVVVRPCDDGVSLVVEDGGTGITSPPSRGESGSGSTGLGLDIARRAAESSGGSFLVGTGAGGGARVELRFRLSDHSRPRRDPSPS
jgi:signal transduction histidine kinase